MLPPFVRVTLLVVVVPKTFATLLAIFWATIALYLEKICVVCSSCAVCLVVQRPLMKYAAVDADLGDCAVPPIVVTFCVRGGQIYVSAAGYKQ